MSSHMLAPFGRVWDYDRERDNEPDDEQMQVRCEECKQDTDLADMWLGRNDEPVCYACWFRTCAA